MQEKYGSDITNPAQLQSTKDKVKQTNFEKYGDWYGKTETYKEQVKQNALEKYGVLIPDEAKEAIAKYRKNILGMKIKDMTLEDKKYLLLIITLEKPLCKISAQKLRAIYRQKMY